MPHFNAPLSGHSALYGDLFVLDVVDPTSDPANPNTIGAVVAPELYTTRMSPQIAALYGADSEAQTISVVIHQTSYSTLRVHEFDPIELEVRFAKPRLGPNYLCLGMTDLEKFFEILLYQPKADNPDSPFLYFDPKQNYRSMCRQL
ncbi:MAG: hypothetical protein KF861_04385 [Planctomycetaceae bacterium]|nr:hypothetical protein [Planctomycetaceae bacterium]